LLLLRLLLRRRAVSWHAVLVRLLLRLRD